MKIVLASQGFMTQEIASETAGLAGKPLYSLNVAIINESYVGISAGRDHRWMLDELGLLAKYVKGTIAFVNLLAYEPDELKRRIDFADLIYIVGGAQATLPKIFKQTGFDTIIKEAASEKVIFGTSAGSYVLGKQIESKEYWLNQYGSYVEFLAEPTMGLVDFNILPHFGREDHPNRNTEILEPILKNNPFPIYGISDTQAVIFDDGKTNFVGGTPVKFGQQYP